MDVTELFTLHGLKSRNPCSRGQPRRLDWLWECYKN